MTKTIACGFASLILLAGPSELTLSTDYQSGLNLRLEHTTSLVMETTAFEVLRNGEPMDLDGFGDDGSSDERTVVTIDRIVEAADGVPTKLTREFETVEGTRTSGRRGEELYLCPLDGVTLELRLEDEEVEVEVTDGDEPDDEAALEGHRLRLLTDALLPEGEVESDASWELSGEQVARVLGLDLDRAMFAREPRGEGGGREGGRGRGPGGRGGAGGGALSLFRAAEWTATATLVDTAEDLDGDTCARIEFVFEAEGELAEPEFGGGRGRMFEPKTARPFESTYEIELKGFLLFSVESRLPRRMEIEGTLATEMNTVRERGDMSIEMQREEVGTFECTLEVTEAEDA